MPSLSSQTSSTSRPALGHVNMQMDCFIAHANVDDLRYIVRSLLATGPAGTKSAFNQIARPRVLNTAPKGLPSSPNALFVTSDDNAPEAAQPLWDVINRARVLFGLGLAFESLSFLTFIVSATAGLRWEIDSVMEDQMAIVDGDIAQAIQSCREQIAGNGLTMGIEAARTALAQLKDALLASRSETQSWGGEFLFEKGLMSLEGWKFS